MMYCFVAVLQVMSRSVLGGSPLPESTNGVPGGPVSGVALRSLRPCGDGVAGAATGPGSPATPGTCGGVTGFAVARAEAGARATARSRELRLQCLPTGAVIRCEALVPLCMCVVSLRSRVVCGYGVIDHSVPGITGLYVTDLPGLPFVLSWATMSNLNVPSG